MKRLFFLFALIVVTGGVLLILFDGSGTFREIPSAAADRDADEIQPSIIPSRAESEERTIADIAQDKLSREKRSAVPPLDEGSLVIRGLAMTEDGRPPPRPIGITVSQKRPPLAFYSLAGGRGFKRYIEKEEELAQACSQRLVFTGTDGRFILEKLGSAKVYLIPVDPFFYSIRPSRVTPIESDEDETTRFVLRLGGEVEGVVKDSMGRALAGAKVTLREKFNPLIALSGRKGFIRPFSTATNTDGFYSFRAVPCDTVVVLDVSAEGHGACLADPVTPRPGITVTADITLPRAASVSGVVKNEDSSVAEGIKVSLAKTDNILDSVSGGKEKKAVKKITDSDGAFFFEDLAPGTYKAFINESGYMRSALSEIELAPGDEYDGIVLVLEKGLSISGRIVDSKEHPLPGAVIKPMPGFNLADLGNFIEDSMYVRKSKSEEDGSFSCDGLKKGTYNLEITRNGITDSSQKGIDAGTTGLVITLKSGGIAGIVVSAVDGEPVRDFRINIEPTGSRDLLDPFGIKTKITRSVQNDSGLFEVSPLRPDEYKMTIKAGGFGLYKMDDIVIEDGVTKQGIVVMMAAEASISGLVFDKETGEPVEGARISTQGGLKGMIEEFTTKDVVHSDEEGRYRFGNLTAGRARLHVSHPNYEPVSLNDIILLDGEAMEGVDIELSRGGVIHGTVTGAGGRPVNGANIMASSPTGMFLRSTRTADDGAYELAGFPPGTYIVMLMAMNFDMNDDFLGSLAGGFERKYITLQKDQVLECNFQMEGETRPVVVHGEITDSRGSAARSIVTLVPVNEKGKSSQPGEQRETATSSTDSEGRYRFQGIRPGDYTFRVVRTDSISMGGGTESVFRIKVPDTETFEYNARLPGGSISGRISSGDTLKPLSQIRVLLERSEGSSLNDPVSEAMGRRVGEVYTDKGGMFLFSTLKEGTYDITAGGTNVLGINHGGYARSTLAGIDLLEDQNVDDIRIKLEKGGTVEGFLKDKEGRPVAGASIFFQPARSGKFDTYSECYSDGSGQFRYPGLAPGRYTLAVKHLDYAITLVYDVVVVKEKTKEINLTLGPGTALSVMIRNSADNAPVAGAQIDFMDGSGNRLSDLVGLDDIMKIFFSGGSASEGVYNLGRYAPGFYRLEVSHPSYGTQSLDVEIAAGEENRVVSVAF